MKHQAERIEFLIQGGSAKPYKVSFWRIGNNVKSSCTCPAGKNGRACKHRLSILDGDVTNLVSSSQDSFQKLQKMLEGSDVGAALHALDSVTLPSLTLEKLLPLKPPGRRKSIAPDILAQSVIHGGLIKGNQNYYDVFDRDLNYLGSVKVRRGTVFSENLADYFSGVTLTVKRITDGLVWERSQSVYAASIGSPMALILDGGIEKTSQQKNLKRTLTD